MLGFLSFSRRLSGSILNARRKEIAESTLRIGKGGSKGGLTTTLFRRATYDCVWVGQDATEKRTNHETESE